MTKPKKSLLARCYWATREFLSKTETKAFAGLAWIVTGIEVLPHHVDNGAYDPVKDQQSLDFSGKNVSNEALSLAKDHLQESRSRVATVMKKVDTLITVTSIAVTGAVTALSFLDFPSGSLFYWAYLISAVVFLLNGWFLFKFLSVGKASMPNLDQAFLNLNNSGQKAALVQDFLAAATQNDLRTNFLVDLYKAGRVLSASSFVIALTLVSVAILDQKGREDRILLKARSDPKLIELLRGPKGDSGLRGERGATGPRGPKGEQYLPSVELQPFDSFIFDMEFTLKQSRPPVILPQASSPLQNPNAH